MVNSCNLLGVPDIDRWGMAGIYLRAIPDICGNIMAVNCWLFLEVNCWLFREVNCLLLPEINCLLFREVNGGLFP